jgi:hypothetical protein
MNSPLFSLFSFLLVLCCCFFSTKIFNHLFICWQDRPIVFSQKQNYISWYALGPFKYKFLFGKKITKRYLSVYHAYERFEMRISHFWKVTKQIKVNSRKNAHMKRKCKKICVDEDDIPWHTTVYCQL